ncbi:MAG: adenylyltransferase/cytidyltransferase family protein [Clostridia bacterium]|nr:adenylyltransferase/cytidyltransferase family protein [Clostridia bacterium]
MRVVNTADMEPLKTPTVVCLGYFDGVHRGHLALLEEAKRLARERGLLVCVHALDRSPAQALHPERRIIQLTTPAEKERLFEAAGCDILAVSPFDDRVRHMPGGVFFSDVLLGSLNARAIVTGDDHRFGFKGDTGSEELCLLCERAGVALSVVPRVTLADGTVISSSVIREALRAGDLARAEEMLGRPVSPDMLEGCAERGQERQGRTL